jgi:hypothetical protein
MGTITTSFHSSSIVASATTIMFLLVALVMLILLSTNQIFKINFLLIKYLIGSNPPPSPQPPNYVGPGDVHLLLLISWLLHPSQASLCVV